ncbi:MAG: SPOR domain-containing protein [Desulfohalobiaceae bacterium]|nr:SPOR domain-containing protein [Desulfohalobiaceae bacterium]
MFRTRHFSVQKAVWLLLLLVLPAVGLVLVLVTVSPDFRQQLRTLAPFAGTSQSRPSPGPMLRFPIQKQIRPEPEPPLQAKKPQAGDQGIPSTDSRASKGPVPANGTEPSASLAEPEPAEPAEAAPASEPATETAGQKPEQQEEPARDKAFAFAIQAGACREPVNARYLAAELKAEGYQPRMFKDRHANGEIWHKVLIGAYETRTLAEKALERFQKRHKGTGFVIRIRYQ